MVQIATACSSATRMQRHRSPRHPDLIALSGTRIPAPMALCRNRTCLRLLRRSCPSKNFFQIHVTIRRPRVAPRGPTGPAAPAHLSGAHYSGHVARARGDKHAWPWCLYRPDLTPFQAGLSTCFTAPNYPSTPAAGAFTFTDAIPVSRALLHVYISLVPTISPLAAFSTKYSVPSRASRRWSGRRWWRWP